MDAVIDFAPSTDAAPRKSAAMNRVERWLEAQRDQLPLWLPVAFGTGDAAWFSPPSHDAWIGWRVARGALVAAALAGALGRGGSWWRASFVAAPV